MTEIDDLRERLRKKELQYDQAKRNLRTSMIRQVEAEDKLEIVTVAQNILQEAARNVQAYTHRRLADIVTRCLQTIFDDPYKFKIQFTKRRGKTEADLLFARNGNQVKPMGAAGGGVVDIAAFALRLTSLLMRRYRLRRVLVLDEPFRFVSAEYRPAVRALVQELAAELGFQFITVTHAEELVIGKVVRLGRPE